MQGCAGFFGIVPIATCCMESRIFGFRAVELKFEGSVGVGSL